MDASNREHKTDNTWFASAFTPEVVLHRRVDPEAFVHYVVALRRAIENLVKALPDVRGDLQIACALLPGGKRILDFHCQPENLDPNFQNGLRESLGALAIPVVREGPVVLTFRVLLGLTVPEGGALPPFPFPFMLLFPRGISRFDEVLMRVAGVAPEETAGPPRSTEGVGAHGWRNVGRPSLWHRLKTWLLNQREIILPPVEETIPASGDAREPDLPPEVQSRSSGACTIEEFTEWIRRHPDSARLRCLRAAQLHHEGKLDAAIEDFSAAIALRPHDANAFADRGACHLQAGRLEPGLADMNEALRLEPDHVGALDGRAMVYGELGAWPQAVLDIENAVTLAPFLVRLRLLRAKLWLFRADGHSDANRAVADLDEVLTLDPFHKEAYRLRARARQLSIVHDGLLDETAAAPILSDLEQAIWLDPGSAPAYLERAFVLRRSGNLDGARADLERALELDPDQPEALGLRGLVSFARSDFDQALRDCTAAIEKGAVLPEFLLCRAEILSTRGDLDLALEAIDRVLEIRPNDPDVLLHRGNIHLQRDDADAAIADFTEVLRRKPGNTLARVNRGLARWSTDSAVALEDFEEALRGDPTLAHAHFYRGVVLIGQGRRAEALESLGDAIRLAPDFEPPYLVRGCLRREAGDLEGALADLEVVIRLTPEFPQAYYERGCLFAGRGELDAALQDFDHLIDLCPSGRAYIGRAKVRIEQGAFDRAEEDYREAIHLSPGNAEDFILDRLATEAAYYHKAARHAEAIERASEALELRPDFFPAYFQRGCASWYCGRLTEAAEDFGRILELLGESGLILGCRGQVYAEMEEFHRAIADLDRALELSRDTRDNAGTAYALSGRGLARGGLGLFEEAARDFEESLRLCPDNAWAHLNLGIVLEKQGKGTEAAMALRRALQADQPPLPTRKRSRAEALLARLKPQEESREQG